MEKEVIVSGDKSRQFVDTICIPAIKEVVCRWGAKCFHNIHYADCFTPFGQSSCVPIPNGACLQGLPTITNFFLEFLGQTTGDCCRVRVTYTIVAIVIDFATGTPIGVIQEDVEVFLQIPTFPVPGPLCFGPIITEDAFVITFPRVYSATIACVNGINQAIFRVEKEFGCFKSQRAIICQLDCAPDEPACTPPSPTPPTSPFCPEFTTPTVCFEFCVDDELFSPYNCDQCPPPQVFTDPTPVPCNNNTGG